MSPKVLIFQMSFFNDKIFWFFSTSIKVYVLGTLVIFRIDYYRGICVSLIHVVASYLDEYINQGVTTDNQTVEQREHRESTSLKNSQGKFEDYQYFTTFKKHALNILRIVCLQGNLYNRWENQQFYSTDTSTYCIKWWKYTCWFFGVCFSWTY